MTYEDDDFYYEDDEDDDPSYWDDFDFDDDEEDEDEDDPYSLALAESESLWEELLDQAIDGDRTAEALITSWGALASTAYQSEDLRLRVLNGLSDLIEKLRDGEGPGSLALLLR